jgi:glutamyl-tRNA(Gln) amidotransferase subunit E
MDYKQIGLKCGIEIHQQLEGKKLFCNCPTSISEDNDFDYRVNRRIRAVIGESGNVDIAAVKEMQKKKYFEYLFNPKNSCLIELDEQPPNSINQDALKVSFQTANLIKSEIVDEVQVMRKTVINGSNTTGFQRTALISMGGEIKTSEGIVRVDTLCLEEDAAKEVATTPEKVVYNLSRLGIPLIEIATKPDIKTPTQCQECAKEIGMFLRSTGSVKRGLGTIRQDVNVSIKGGERIEIKGAQDLKLIPDLIINEIKRQQSLIEIKNLVPKDYAITPEHIDLTSIFKDSESKVIKSALKKGVVMGINVPNMAGLIGKQTQPGKRLGSEISDYAKVSSGVGGLFHSDELPKYGITDSDVSNVRKKLNCKEKDAFIIIADKKEKVIQALNSAIERINLIKTGVIKEVRKANLDATTSYLRPIPGSDRMYPETDVLGIKPQQIDFKDVELLSTKCKRFEKELNLGHDLAEKLVYSQKLNLFETAISTYKNIKPSFLAECLISLAREIRRKDNLDINQLSDKDFLEIFAYLDEDKISKDMLGEALKSKFLGNFNLDDYKLMSDSDIENKVKQILPKFKDKPMGAVMGALMKEFSGKVDGKKLNQIVKKYLN